MPPIPAADVCIVGSGFAGTLLARSLVAAGLRTVMLEAGAGTPATDAGDPRRYDYTLAGTTPARYEVQTRYKWVGGHSHTWGGMSRRLPAATIDGDPARNLQPWPVRLSTLEPYYYAAERLVGGDGTDFPPGDEQRDDRLASSAPRPGDWQGAFALSARLRGGLVPYHARVSRLVLTAQLLPQLEQHRLFQLIPSAQAVRVLSTETDRADGIRYTRPDGTTADVHARAVVLAGGALETPRLMLASASAAHPNGVGNRNRLVGTHFTEHFVYEPDYLCLRGERYTPAGLSWKHNWRVDDGNPGFHLLAAGLRSERTTRDVILQEPLWGDALAARLARTVGYHASVVALGELDAVPANRVDLDGAARDAAGVPVARITWTPTEGDRLRLAAVRALVDDLHRPLGLVHTEAPERVFGPATLTGGHLLGTCRMGTDPATSVVDGNACVHGMPNLFVSGSATFPSGGSENPTLTICALALRLADHLAMRLRDLPEARVTS